MFEEGWSDDFEPVDFLRPLAILALFIYYGFGSMNRWIKADVIAGLLFGACLTVFPSVCLEIQTNGKIDGVHLLYCQFFGFFLFSSSAMWVWNRKTRDDVFWVVAFLSRVVSVSLLFYAQYLAHKNGTGKSQTWTMQHVLLGIGGTALWLAGNLRQLVTVQDLAAPGIDKKDSLNIFLIIDFALCCAGFVFNYCYTDWVLETVTRKSFKPDPIHINLVRSCGTMWLCFALLTLGMFWARDKRLKRSPFLIRLLSVPFLAAILIPHMMDPKSRFDKEALGGSLLQYALTVGLNSVLAYLWTARQGFK